MITEITLNQTEDGQTVAVVSETSAQGHVEGEQPSHQVICCTLIVMVLSSPLNGHPEVTLCS